MPEVKKVMDAFKKQYGFKEGEKRYYAWKKEKPEAFKKGLATAKKKGDTIIGGNMKKTKKIGKAKKK